MKGKHFPNQCTTCLFLKKSSTPFSLIHVLKCSLSDSALIIRCFLDMPYLKALWFYSDGRLEGDKDHSWRKYKSWSFEWEHEYGPLLGSLTESFINYQSIFQCHKFKKKIQINKLLEQIHILKSILYYLSLGSTCFVSLQNRVRFLQLNEATPFWRRHNTLWLHKSCLHTYLNRKWLDQIKMQSRKITSVLPCQDEMTKPNINCVQLHLHSCMITTNSTSCCNYALLKMTAFPFRISQRMLSHALESTSALMSDNSCNTLSPSSCRPEQ